MIVLVGGEKGGTGKTTLATTLAAIRASAGRDVLLVDTDPQGSASYWASARDEAAERDGRLPPIPSVQVFGKGVAKRLADLAGRYDDLIVDAGGRDSVELRSAMVAANRLFVPVQASQFDVWTLGQMNELVDQAQAVNAALSAAVVINRASTHPQVREAEEAEALLEDFEHLAWTGVVIRDRIAFRRAAADGLAVTEMEPPDPKAIAEVQAWAHAAFE